MDAYKYAMKNKLRFAYKGMISTEDLFGLSLEELDKIYNNLMTQAKKDSYSLLAPVEVDERIAMSIEIIKDIVADKQAELEVRKAEAVKTVQKQKILEALANRQTADLSAKSEEELKKMLDEL